MINLGRESFIVPATEAHVGEIVSRIRAEDIREANALGFPDVAQATKLALQTSSHAWTWLIEGKVGCIWGVSTATLLVDAHTVWLVSTKEVETHRRHFLRHSRKLVKEIASYHGSISNVVDSRYTTCVTWLRWLGFTVGDAEPIGKNKALFHKFEMKG